MKSIKRLKRFGLLLTSCALILGMLVPVWAQTSVTINVEDLTVEENRFPEMSAIVSVLNQSKVPLQDLTAQNFEVYEGSQPIPVTAVNTVTDTNQSLAVALVLDLSLSSPVEEAKAAANWLLDSLGPNDRVALIGFNQPPELNTFDPAKEVDFTTNKELVRDVVNGFDESSLVGVSAVYQAIYKGVYVTVQQKADRRAVVVVTDGYQYTQDTFEADKPKTLAQNELVPIFTIGVYNPPDFLGAPDYLQELAQETGGQYQEATDPSRLTNLFQDVVGQLWTKYELVFHSPDLERDGKDHVLTFQVSTPEGNDTVNRTVSYPGQPPVPEVDRIQEDINGDLQDLRSSLRGEVLLVPQISAQNPIVEVQYWLDDEVIHTVVVDVQESGKHAPWEWKWNTCGTGEKAHVLGIVARDDTGAASDKYLQDITIDREGSVCVPVLGEVDSTTMILLGAGLLLLLLIIVALIVASRRRASEPVYEPTFAGPPTVPSTPGSLPPTASGPSPPPPPPPAGPPAPSVGGYNPTTPVQAPSGASPAPRPAAKTEVLYQQPSAMAWLVAQQGPMSGREFRLGESISIGRTGENDIVLDEPAVSRQHAKVKLEGKVFTLYDLGATNTTQVNGQEIARHQLKDGDRVEVGRSVFIFKQIQSD